MKPLFGALVPAKNFGSESTVSDHQSHDLGSHFYEGLYAILGPVTDLAKFLKRERDDAANGGGLIGGD